ncbi:tankyrase-2-like isoform X1 [Pomacea canaliculata]|uniref:tankyrase-2-like isoform X1 n=2 Tax=Pomacea canaliculata TaxID=400727 RepID=UPI000D73CC06|nr:tankyrase-2-like isoform X1 [Pomacea canaliculata]
MCSFCSIQLESSSTEASMAQEDTEQWLKELMAVIKAGHTQRVGELLAAGFDINRVEEDERMSPLSLACQSGNVEIAKMLLEHGADVNVPGPDGQMALHHLCSAEEWKPELAELGELLIAHGASLDAADNTGATPVLKACEVESHRLVQALCSAGCDVNIPTVNGDSPIQVACKSSELWFSWYCRPEHATAAKGTSDRERDPRCFPPIIIAKTLLQAGADPKEATLLPAAVQFGAVGIVKEFLQLGMDVNRLDDNQRTPLGCACTSASSSLSLVQLLLEHGADVNKGGGWRKHKPLIFAYVHNSVDKIRLLLSYGAKITAEEMSELVSLSLSKSILGNPEVIGPTSKELLSWRLLLKAGSRPLVQGTLATKVHQLSMCSSYSQISPWIHTLLNPLLSLKDICRITVRRHLPISIDSSIEQLPLPRSLKNFLMFKEFSIQEREL